jgi:hypothetical protein
MLYVVKETATSTTFNFIMAGFCLPIEEFGTLLL